MTWVVTIVLAAGMLGGWETLLRRNGARPAVVDDKYLWAWHRDRVYTDDRIPVVLVGASRIQCGFSPEVFERLYPRYRVRSLAVDGSSPVPTLLDLAADEDFKGIILCSISTRHLQDIDCKALQYEYVRFYHDEYGTPRTWNEHLNSRIGQTLQANLVSMNPAYNVDRSLRTIVKTRRLPEPFYVITRPDRSRQADYTLTNVERLKRAQIKWLTERINTERVPPPDLWGARVAEFRPHIEKIQNRGGKVVLLRLPQTGGAYTLAEQLYPRAQYWDKLAELTGAETIHFLDTPGMKDLQCPETSHLDYRDAGKMTAALAEELERRKIIRR